MCMCPNKMSPPYTGFTSAANIMTMRIKTSSAWALEPHRSQPSYLPLSLGTASRASFRGSLGVTGFHYTVA